MSTFQSVKSTLSPLLAPKSCDIYSNFYVSGIRLFNSFQSKRLSSVATNRRRLLKTCCKTGGSENRSNGEEAPESLFMKELRRRGMTPTSLLEETKIEEDEISSQPRDAAVPQNAQLNQREQSMALNSEGLEGLIPRATLLLTLGGTFFLAFRPLILLTVACFFAMYLFFGTKFVHDGTDYDTTIPQYMDPYQLVERKE